MCSTTGPARRSDGRPQPRYSMSSLRSPLQHDPLSFALPKPLVGRLVRQHTKATPTLSRTGPGCRGRTRRRAGRRLSGRSGRRPSGRARPPRAGLSCFVFVQQDVALEHVRGVRVGVVVEPHHVLVRLRRVWPHRCRRASAWAARQTGAAGLPVGGGAFQVRRPRGGRGFFCRWPET